MEPLNELNERIENNFNYKQFSDEEDEHNAIYVSPQFEIEETSKSKIYIRMHQFFQDPIYPIKFDNTITDLYTFKYKDRLLEFNLLMGNYSPKFCKIDNPKNLYGILINYHDGKIMCNYKHFIGEFKKHFKYFIFSDNQVIFFKYNNKVLRLIIYLYDNSGKIGEFDHFEYGILSDDTIINFGDSFIDNSRTNSVIFKRYLLNKLPLYKDANNIIADYLPTINYESFRIHKNNNIQSMYILDEIEFPKPSNIKINMMPFIIDDKNSLPSEYHHYWDMIQKSFNKKYETKTNIVTNIPGIYCKNKIVYLTIHESLVEPDMSQRRGGIHTEGFGNLKETPNGYKRFPFYWGRGCRVNNKLCDGIIMANNIDNSCRIWDVQVKREETGKLGDVEHLRPLLGKGYNIPKNRLIWFTDLTPHESLPIKEKVYRQFFRLVLGDISVWYSQHSTKNRLGIVPPPSVKIINENKFKN